MGSERGLIEEFDPRRSRRLPNLLRVKWRRRAEEHGAIGRRRRVALIRCKPPGESVGLRRQLDPSMRSHKFPISSNARIVVAPVKWRTHSLFVRASATVAFLFLAPTEAKTVGAIRMGHDPINQLSVDLPSPRWIVVAAWNTATTSRSDDLSSSRPSARA
jgi:hypothetical protein